MVKKAIKTTILTLTGVSAAVLLCLSSIGGTVSAVNESASLSSSGVSFEITPTSANPNGTVAIGTDNLTVSSTCSSGYKLYISTTSNDETDSALKNADNSEYSIPAVSGTIASPTLLNSFASKNHWGFAMASGDTGTATTGFVDPTVSNSSLFASIPTLNNMTVVRQETSSADNETVNVYYGVNAGTDLTPGSYSSTVMYTMIMPSPCDYTLMFEDGVSDSDPIESAVTKMPESTNIGRNVSVNLGDYKDQFSREGYSITGWKNLTDDITYTKDQVININTNNADIIKLAPIWTLNTYTVALSSGTGITSTTITVSEDTSSDTNKTGTTVTDSSPSITVGFGSTLQISYLITSGYHFTEWEITDVDIDADGNPLLTEDDFTLESGLDSGNNSVYSFAVPASDVALTAKAEGNKYTVHFDANGGTGEMTDVEMVYGSPATLPENTFTAPDSSSEFYGWSAEAQTPSTNPTRDYTNGQMGVFNLTTSNPAGTGEATLYAVWKITFGEDTMQGWTGCSSLVISTTSNYNNANTYADLKDVRNNVSYRVRRYNDDACWMAENLRLTPGNSDPGTDTVNSGALTTTTSTSEAVGSIDFTSTFSSSSFAEVQAIYLGNTTNGAYYSWGAAQLACPSGWSLPTDIQYSAFLTSEKITDSSAGYTKIMGMPYNFPHAGNYNYQSLYNDDDTGFYWSSVQVDSTHGYDLEFYGSRMYVGNRSKNNGFSVRCIQANEMTMQSFTAEQCAELTASTTDNYEDKSTYRILRDTRNSVFYTIRRYADNMCWMAENLRVTPGSTDPGTSTVDSGTLTTSAADSEAAGSVVFEPSFDNVSYIRVQGIYKGNITYGAYYSRPTVNLVCPAGWTSPTSTQYDTFLSSESIENSSVGSVKIQDAPYSFPLAGYYKGSSLVDTDNIAYYWASQGGSYGNYLRLGSSFAYVSYDSAQNLNQGYSVRCVHP